MRDLESLRADLRAALLVGGDTAALRAAIVQAQAGQRAEAQRRAQAAAAREAAEAERIRQTAETIAAGAAARLAVLMEPLQPPAMPVSLDSTR